VSPRVAGRWWRFRASCLLAISFAAIAQSGPDPSSRPPPGRSRSLAVPETVSAPVIDGRLDDNAWSGAAVADRFWISEQQRWPTESTEVRVTASRTHLYVAVRAFDRQPAAIEALQTRRDGGFGFDDQVVVELDPFLTYREISTFSVNAAGTQADAFAGGRVRQLAWKGDWQAAVGRDAEGWTVEIAIPYEILNFQPGTHTIGVNFLRYHHRSGEWSRWADVTVRALPEEMGQLTGLRPSVPGSKQEWTLLPYALVGRNIPDRDGEIRDRLATAGIDIRYEPRPNVTGVASLLPDFSQVEEAVTSADFSYNEKFRGDLRPFFVEGAAYFGDGAPGGKASTTSKYFYSNRVPDFNVAGKAYGRSDGLQVGALVTRAPGERTDFVADIRRQFDRTHQLGAMLVGTDSPALRNQLVVLRGSGREPSGFNYAFDAAATRTDPVPGDGSHARGALGWAQGHWSAGATLDRYSREFFPANGLLASDLPDTAGGQAYLSHYRDLAEGPLREVTGDLSFDERRTGDGRTQRRQWYAGGSVELRQAQVRLGAYYTAGPYRPVGAAPGEWSDTVNDDRYGTLSADFETRNSRFGYGLALSSGQLGGGDYRYANGYLWARPLPALAVNLSLERLENFGTYDQAVLTGTWDITPAHTISGRVIDAYYGNAYRLAYTWRARKNLDLFVVYDDSPGQPEQLSAKLLATY
jgi:hypothetical protein